MSKSKQLLLILLTGPTMLWELYSDSLRFSHLDKYQTPVPYADERDWEVTQNLGATGARAWVEGRKGNTANSRELVIKSITPGSPSDGVLEPYDIIIGIDKTPFSTDARMSFAKALTEAEGNEKGGVLRLLCVRNGKTQTIEVNLPIMGDFSPTAPFNCLKTKKIIDDSTNFLVDFAPDDGYADIPGATNALLLLAARKPAHFDVVRRSAMNMGPNHKISDHYLNTWRWGYVNLFLCEYYLATGDARVLPSIADYSNRLTQGQVNPGTWGHRVMKDDMPPGYGVMNQSGLVCFISLILAEQCGVEFDHRALERSIKFYGRYVDWGGIPYGDHEPYQDASSNGKNGSAAVAFHLLGAERASQWFAQMAASTNQDNFEEGHTGNIWGQLWTPIGASLTGTTNYQNFWKRFNSLRDLARYWKGGFLSQSQPNLREGTMGINHYRGGPLYATGRYGLGYLAKSGALAILGRRESVFGKNPPMELHKALTAYHQKNYQKSIPLATQYLKSEHPRVRAMAEQIRSMAKLNIESIKLSKSSIQENMNLGDYYLAKRQVEGLEGILPEKDLSLSPIQDTLNKPETLEVIKSRKDWIYTRLFETFVVQGPKDFWEHPLPPVGDQWRWTKLPGFLKTAKGFYKTQAQKAQVIIGNPPHSKKLFESIKITEKNPKASTEFKAEEVSMIRELRAIWSVKGHMEVKLNGKVILDLNVPKGFATREIILKPITIELLKEGLNKLEVIEKNSKGSTGEISLVAIKDSEPT